MYYSRFRSQIVFFFGTKTTAKRQTARTGRGNPPPHKISFQKRGRKTKKTHWRREKGRTQGENKEKKTHTTSQVGRGTPPPPKTFNPTGGLEKKDGPAGKNQKSQPKHKGRSQREGGEKETKQLLPGGGRTSWKNSHTVPFPEHSPDVHKKSGPRAGG